MMPKDSADAILREHGLKQTAGRKALVRLLLNAGKPLSHREICAALQSLPYDPVSIYRSLEAFVRSGLAHRIEDDNHTWLFAICPCSESKHCHPHFFCRSCGKCECLKECGMPEIDGLQDRYIVEEKRFYVKGICGSCASAENLR